MNNRFNILLIEDNPDDQFLVKEYLDETDFKSQRIVVVDNFTGGLEELAKGKTDLLLLDLSLPDSFGLEGLNQVLEHHPLLAVIILTGLENDEVAIEAIRQGAQDYLVKGKFDEYTLGKSMTYALERKKSEVMLRRQAEELEQFAYLCAHNLKAPVTNLDSLLMLAEEVGEGKLRDKDLFDRLKESVAQMRATLRSLSEVMSIKKSLNQELEEIALTEIFQTATAAIENHAEASQAKITTDFSGYPKVQFPAVHLKVIFQNLLTNAIKYRRQSEPLRISVWSEPHNSGAVINFKDNGRGINLDQYGHKLFGLFQRFHLDVDEGQGVGLHLCKIIIENYGGDIEVLSKENQGTTFKIYLS